MDIRRIRRLLRETGKIAEHASLTGSLEKGSRLAIRQYNAIRQHLQDEEVIPEDLFPDLDEDEAGFDELGVAAKLLDGYLEGDDEAESSDNGCGKQKRVEIRLGGSAGIGGLADLKNIGEIIRSHMPEIIREYVPTPSTPPTPPTPPVAPTPPAPPGAPVGAASFTTSFTTSTSPSEPVVSDAMRSLLEELRQEHLSEERRAEIAAEIVRLAQAG